MTYTYTQALVLIYNKHITVTDIHNFFMNSYNKLIHILVLIANLYLLRFPLGSTELILVLITDLYLIRSLLGISGLILVLITDLYLFRGIRRYYRAYTCTEVSIGNMELILVQRYSWVHSRQKNIHYFTLIRYLDSDHITV